MQQDAAINLKKLNFDKQIQQVLVYWDKCVKKFSKNPDI